MQTHERLWSEISLFFRSHISNAGDGNSHAWNVGVRAKFPTLLQYQKMVNGTGTIPVINDEIPRIAP